MRDLRELYGFLENMINTNNPALKVGTRGFTPFSKARKNSILTYLRLPTC